MKAHYKILSALMSFIMLLSLCVAVLDTAMARVIEDIVYFEEDFDGGDYADFEVDKDYTASDFKAIRPGTVADTWKGVYTIKKTSTGKKYLSMTRETYYNGGYRMTFGTTVPDTQSFKAGYLVAEMKFLATTDGTTDRKLIGFYGPFGAGTKNCYSLSSNNGEALVTADSSVWGNGVAVDATPDVDDDGFYNLRAVLSRETEQDNWNLTIYDALNGNVIKSASDITADFAEAVERVTFVSLYGMPADTLTSTANITDLKVYTPADAELVRMNDYDADDKKLVYEASEELLEDSVSEDSVKVIDPDGDEVVGVSAVLDENGVDIELSFEYGLPKDGTYTVITDGVMTARCIPVEYEGTFEGEKTVIPFEITDITPAEGNIYRDEGSISVGFTHEIHPSAASFISFTKANGDPVNGGYEVAVNGRTAILSFGKLSLGDYILTIDSALVSEDEESVLGEEKIYNFTAVERPPIGEDFTSDDYEIGTVYSGTELASLSEHFSYGTNGIYLIEEDGGDKFVTMSVDAINTGASMIMTPDEVIKDGVLEVGLRLKGTSGNLSRGIFAVYAKGSDGADTTTRLLSMDAGTAVTVSADSTSLGGSFCSDAPVNKDDFFNIKLRLSAGNTETDWTVEVFDLNNSEKLFYSASLPRNKAKSITRLTLCNIWPIASGELERSLSVSEVWYRYTECISIIDSDTDVLPTADSISFRFDDDIPYENITARLVAEDETQIDCEYVYDEELRELTLMPKSFLDWSTSYKLVLEGADVKDYSFSTAPADSSLVSKSITYITDSGNTDTKPLEGSFDVMADVKINASGKKEFLLVAIAYDASGYPIEIEEKSFENVNQSASDYVVLEDVSALKCNSVKCFLWQKTDNGYRQVK